MIRSVGGRDAAEAAQASQAANSSIVNAGAGEAGDLFSHEKDAKESATSANFGEVYKQIQAKYGAKPEKAREIKKTLGKDDFLKIMLTQMKHQDPTNPFKAEQMATEIAQFTSIEQLQNVNQNLNKMANQNRPLEQMAMTNLIGKIVVIDRERFPHVDGQSDSLTYNLSKNAASARISILSDSGETVFEKDLGPQHSGEVTFNWDGLKTNSLASKSGNYIYRIDAKDEHGKTIETNPQAQARIIGVSFDGAEPVFLVGDAKHQDKITMRNIVRVETDVGQDLKGKGFAAITKPAQSENNFFGFKKGIGSGQLQEFAQDAPSVLGTQKVQVADQEAGPVEKGFPNGLSENDDVKQNEMSANLMKGGEKNE